MPRRLFIHIGTHKTGTTSFQRALADHRPALLRSGIGVVTEPDRRGRTSANSQGLANSVLRRSLRTALRVRRGLASPTWRDFVSHAGALRASIELLGTPDLVVSAEAFCFARTRAEHARVRALLRWCGSPEVVPILTVRNVDDWRASWESELQRGGVRHGRDWGTGTDNVLGAWYYDLDAIRDFWSAFGTPRIVDFDLVMKVEGSIVPSLVEAIERPRELLTRDYRANRRAVSR